MCANLAEKPVTGARCISFDKLNSGITASLKELSSQIRHSQHERDERSAETEEKHRHAMKGGKVGELNAKSVATATI